MALIKRRNKYYARIRWYLTNGKRKEIQIPLKTSSLTEARTRLKLVEKWAFKVTCSVQMINTLTGKFHCFGVFSKEIQI